MSIVGRITHASTLKRNVTQVNMLRGELIFIFDSVCSGELSIVFFTSVLVFKFSFFQISILSSEKSGVEKINKIKQSEAMK